MKLFSKTLVNTLEKGKNMDSLSKNMMGGGYKPTQDIIEIRAKQFAERHYHVAISRLPIQYRQNMAWCLYNYFGMSRGDIAHFLGVSSSTAYKDISDAEFLINRYNYRQEQVDEIRSYILYNAKYLH